MNAGEPLGVCSERARRTAAPRNDVALRSDSSAAALGAEMHNRAFDNERKRAHGRKRKTRGRKKRDKEEKEQRRREGKSDKEKGGRGEREGRSPDESRDLQISLYASRNSSVVTSAIWSEG